MVECEGALRLLTSRLIKGAFASEGVSHNVGYKRGGKSVFVSATFVRIETSTFDSLRIIHHARNVKM